ncbi:transcriptional regulator [Cupriavidus sp. TA19]|uniref:GlxA family transcriptional regulator n=1 Tax=Cupriavidus sp. TA19 TaxID=701108 RepID=UPI00272948ED|nr:GlxA family transcriptional regulator [Cupriavidus sp. TA19]GLC91320.1 transcriptional regulator [Cupriavidus sp. TA19]
MTKITVGILLFPGFQLLDVAGPRDAFSEAEALSRRVHQYSIMTIGSTRGSITSSSGMTVVPDRTIFDPCPEFDTVLVPGGVGIFDAMQDISLCDWVAARSRTCRRLAAICNGAFLLGAAGLLNGRTATTHWIDATNLARRFPQAIIEPDRIYVKDKSIYTTAGVTAGIDLSLALIEEDYGRGLALDVAKYLVVYLRRAGGQSQFSPLLDAQGTANSEVERIQHYLQENLRQQHTLDSIAKKAHMSARNLSRLFARDCGISPMAFLNDARIDAARRFLEETDFSMKEIATKCGFDSQTGLRRAFQRRLQLTPLEYKQRFRSMQPEKRKTSTASPKIK